MSTVAYAVHTQTCSYLLDDEGVCRWIISPTGMVPVDVRRCVGAQFVACIDDRVRGGLIGELVLGAAALFVKYDADTGRMVLLRTSSIEQVEFREGDDPGLSVPPPEDDPGIAEPPADALRREPSTERLHDAPTRKAKSAPPAPRDPALPKTEAFPSALSPTEADPRPAPSRARRSTTPPPLPKRSKPPAANAAYDPSVHDAPTARRRPVLPNTLVSGKEKYEDVMASLSKSSNFEDSLLDPDELVRYDDETTVTLTMPLFRPETQAALRGRPPPRPAAGVPPAPPSGHTVTAVRPPTSGQRTSEAPTARAETASDADGPDIQRQDVEGLDEPDTVDP